MSVVGADPGTLCIKCPCHKAVIVVDGEAVCALCDDDDGRHYVAATQAPQPQPAPILDSAPAPQLKPEANMKKYAIRLSEAQIEQIRLAPLFESDSSVSARLGISYANVQFHRAKVRKAAKGNAAPAPAPAPAPVPVPEPAAIEPPQTLVGKNLADPGHADISRATVMLHLSPAALDTWWRRLDLDQKAEIFAANLEFTLDPGARI